MLYLCINNKYIISLYALLLYKKIYYSNYMNNYQLYRSNVRLGGEIKMNMVLNDVDNQLCVTGFHITPVSPLIPYNLFVNKDILNYSHQENIRQFYREVQSGFYNSGIPAKYNTPWPIMDKKISTYANPWHMGCRRIQYKLYKKQFEFFCPLWIENISPTDSIFFKFNIYETLDANKEIILTTKTLFLGENNNEYHNRFVKYIHNYFKDFYMENDDTGGEIMNISFDNHDAWISGVDVLSGNYRKIDISKVVNSVLERERPFIEFNSILCNQFKDNNLIAKQLMNFNLCFNVEDISSSYIMQKMIGKKIRIEVNTGVRHDDGTERMFLHKDFYTNHVYIPKKIFRNHNISEVINNTEAPDDSIKVNVLSYLSEPDNISLMNKNRLSQHIHTWSLKGNNDYIFNVYDGFSGYIKKS